MRTMHSHPLLSYYILFQLQIRVVENTLLVVLLRNFVCILALLLVDEILNLLQVPQVVPVKVQFTGSFARFPVAIVFSHS